MTVDITWKPLEIRPADAGRPGSAAGLAEYLSDRRAIDELLLRNKALVFRDFGVDPGELEQVMDLLLPHRLAYVHGTTPRTKVGDNVYTSTEYPEAFTITMHNELSYAATWPARLFFYCHTPAATGGATPVVDGTRWLESIDDEVREAFAQGLIYRQNLHGGLGLGKSWQDSFEVDSREAAEEILASTGATWQWRADGGLRINQPAPSTLKHPVTGEEVWFNQSDQWHIAGLEEEYAMALAEMMPEEDFPQSVTFADGSPIPAEYVRQVRDRGLEAAIDVDWRAGDLMVIDNVAVGHGRRPYSGARRILVGMSD
ncbi:TauD/TfdA family dioxygenase [Micromonospora sp. NPDC048843]|uniref:TauD/TfdA family dioxygenase n=1 Tax=Micromonospora sp. NPDC048843 TaxID=3155389 RepID=UPI0033CFD8A3